MNADLLKLVELQEIDLQIHELETSSREFPEQVAALEEGIRQGQAKMEELSTKLKEIGTERASVESGMAEVNQILERSEDRLNSITSNREYDAVHTEISANQQAVSNAKSRMTALAEDATSGEQSLNEAREQLEKLQAESSPRITELRAKIGAIDGQKAALVDKRNNIITQVTKQIVRSYEHSQKRRKSARVLSEVSPENRTCTVCHKVLESKVAAEVRKGDRLTICQSCGSILVWKDEAAKPPTSAESD